MATVVVGEKNAVVCCDSDKAVEVERFTTTKVPVTTIINSNDSDLASTEATTTISSSDSNSSDNDNDTQTQNKRKAAVNALPTVLVDDSQSLVENNKRLKSEESSDKNNNNAKKTEGKAVPKFPLGTKVLRFFSGSYGWFHGKVTGFDEGFYLITYSDGDREELEEFEVEYCVNNIGKYPNAKPQQQVTVQEQTESSNLWNVIPGVTEEFVTEKLRTMDRPKEISDAIWKRLPNVVEFYLYLYERHRVWLRRQGKSTPMGPFSQNYVFQYFHFCNNHRELDRGTAYLRSQILKLKDELESRNVSILEHRLQWLTEVLWLAYVYRTANKVESFDDPKNPAKGIPRLGNFDKAFEDYVWSFPEQGVAFFTGAHITTQYAPYVAMCKRTQSKTSKMSIYKVAKEVFEALDLETVCAKIRNLEGVGDFFAWQIICDLLESHCLTKDYSDKDTFCKLGPGAIKGLGVIFGPSTKGTDQAQLIRSLKDLQPYVEELMGQPFPVWNKQSITLKALEHGLCEIQKYHKIREAGGGIGQRSWKTRVRMDESKPCHNCGEDKDFFAESMGVRCDTCHLILCRACKPSIADLSGGWICHRCVEFDNMFAP